MHEEETQHRMNTIVGLEKEEQDANNNNGQED